MKAKTKTRKIIICLVVACVTALAGVLPTINSHAATQSELNNINSQISALRQKISKYEAEAARLSSQADDLSNQIAMLQSEEKSLEAKIELSQAEHDRLVSEIEVTQDRIDDNSEAIGYIVAQYYYNSEITTIERLASSENFSSFIDEEVELGSISDNISNIVLENKNLKAELEEKKTEVARVLENLESQKASLASKRAERQSLLEKTQGQESLYQSLKSAASSEKAQLEEQQQKLLP